MTPYLLIDFGTTSTKSVLADLDSGAFSHLQRHAALPRLDGPPGHYAVSLEAIAQRFGRICTDYADIAPYRGIVLCSEMHGFALLDNSGRPLTPYIGWLDGRSLEEVDGQSSFDLLTSALGERFKALTGMRPRPGFPLLNLVHLARTSELPTQVRVLSLPDWLAFSAGDDQTKAHPTMLAGMAFYDVHDRCPAAELIDLVQDLGGPRCSLNDPAPEDCPAGYWTHDGRRVPIYVGVGDHQCSVLGAGNAPRASLSINLGTGSQVALIDQRVDHPQIETRPFFGDSFLQAISHIPAGRVLNEFIGFLHEVHPDRDFWALLGRLDEKAILEAPLDFDLSLFEGARNYRGGGAITGLNEGNWTLHNYLASLLKAFGRQYIEVLDVFDPDRRVPRCILSGGIAQKLPALHTLLAQQSGYKVLPATPLDESLLGLRTLALVADGRAAGYVEAQEIFGRDCSLERA